MSPCAISWSRGSRPSTARSRSAIRLRRARLVGPLIDKAAFDGMQSALAQAKAQGGKVHRRRAGAGRSISERLLRASGDRRDAGAERGREARDVCADPLCARLSRFRRGGCAAERRDAGPVVVHLHARHAGGGALRRRRRAAIAASPTSISGRAGPRSAARSAARRKRAAGASPVRIRGRPICGGRRRR